MKNKSALIEAVAFAIFVAAVFVLYYNMYVVPRDKMLHAVMDCMIENDDMSQGGYNMCHSEFLANN